jgi:hypothetical protein
MGDLKKAGLFALAALAVMALAAASASANATICSTEGTGPSCTGSAADGKLYNGSLRGTLESGTSMTIKGSLLTVSCSESAYEGEVTNGEKGTAKITKMTFGLCSSALGSCTTTSSASSFHAWIGTATTRVKGLIDTNGFLDLEELTFHYECGSTTCAYSAATGSEDIQGSQVVNGVHRTATKIATEVPMTLESGSAICSKEAFWNATYTNTSPDTLMII